MIRYNHEMNQETVDENTKRKVLAYDQQMMGARVYFAEPTESVELHQHEQEQFTYILKGRFKFFIKEDAYLLQAGDSIYFEKNIPHGCLVLEPNSELLDVFTPLRTDFIS